MKRIIFLLLILLVACSKNVEIANPASVYCEDMGGKLELKDSVGLCILKDGTVCEEWEYYRGVCPQDGSQNSAFDSVKDKEPDSEGLMKNLVK